MALRSHQATVLVVGVRPRAFATSRHVGRLDLPASPDAARREEAVDCPGPDHLISWAVAVLLAQYSHDTD